MENSVKKLYEAIMSKNALNIYGYLLISSPINCTAEYIDREITALILSN